MEKLGLNQVMMIAGGTLTTAETVVLDTVEDICALVTNCTNTLLTNNAIDDAAADSIINKVCTKIENAI